MKLASQYGIGLELFSGCGRLTKSIRRQLKQVFCIEVDIVHGPQFDLCRQSVQKEITDLIRSGVVRYVWLGTPCNSWSRARRNDGKGPGPLRDDDQFILGFSSCTPVDAEKIKIGNQLMYFSARIFRLCLQLQIPVILENPHTSRLWLAPPIKHLLTHRRVESGWTDFCQDHMPWRKRTKLMWCNISLRSALRQCHGRGTCTCSGRPHVQLVGTQGGKFLTLIAQPYPSLLCRRLGTAISNAVLTSAASILWDDIFHFQG